MINNKTGHEHTECVLRSTSFFCGFIFRDSINSHQFIRKFDELKTHLEYFGHNEHNFLPRPFNVFIFDMVTHHFDLELYFVLC